jgi:hypothetical protein
LLDFSGIHVLLEHTWLLVFTDFLRSFPLHHWHVHGVFRWIDWIIVQTCIISWKLRVTKQRLVLCADLNDLLNLVLDWVFLWLLLLLKLLLLIHHFFTILIHLLSIFLLCLKHLLILLLGDWHAVFSNELILIILSVHHLLLLVLLLLVIQLLLISLLLLRSHLT